MIQLVTEDMPFLVDTVSMTLAQAGLAKQLIIHPILRVHRAQPMVRSARCMRTLEAPADEAGGVHESWQYWRIDPVGDAQDCERLRRRLAGPLADVRRACRDWRRMRNAVTRLCADISRNPPPLAADVVAESRALLQFMESHHFTFLGFRESRLRQGKGGPELIAVPGTALGLLRHRGRGDPGIITANIRRALRSPGLLIITKANHRSTVHRPDYLDYIGVKRFDERGRVVGEARILGLWTSSAYRADPRQVPWLRYKIKHVIERFPFTPYSHDAKRLQQILETLPRDELLQAGVADLVRCARAVLALQERVRVRLFLRRDEFRRFWSCVVYVPRERCDAAAQARIETLLRAALHSSQLDSSLSIGEAPLAVLHVVARVDPSSSPRIDVERLERAIASALVSWRDRLRSALLGVFGTSASPLARAAATPPRSASYQQDVEPALAIADITDLEGLDSAEESMQLRLYRPPHQRLQRAHLRILRRGEALSISDVLPTFEHFGLRVIAERPYRLTWPDGAAAWVQDFELEHYALHSVAVARVADQLIAAFRAIRARTLDDDGFNRLLIASELGVRQVMVLRACCRYLLQTGIPFSQAYMERVLGAHPITARELCELFEQRLAPQPSRGAGGHAYGYSSGASGARSRRWSVRTRTASCGHFSR